jgi:hypothetical protein
MWLFRRIKGWHMPIWRYFGSDIRGIGFRGPDRPYSEIC